MAQNAESPFEKPEESPEFYVDSVHVETQLYGSTRINSRPTYATHALFGVMHCSNADPTAVWTRRHTGISSHARRIRRVRHARLRGYGNRLTISANCSRVNARSVVVLTFPSEPRPIVKIMASSSLGPSPMAT